ncbi:MAG: hypothetical protein OQJ81_10140 [Melioribacteraceae bacterium]|nr:hypothetical protein [Melioribacteraceae bacterium]
MILFIMIFFISCEDEITYKAEFEEEPVLYCIIDAEQNEQYAIVKKSFDDNTAVKENYISDVQISLTTQYQSITLSENEGDGLLFPKNYYYTNSFQPASGNSLTLRALFPDNTEVNSTITLPQFSLFFFEVPSDAPELNIPLEKEFASDFVLRWNIKTLSENLAFLTVLYIDYSKLVGGNEDTNRVEIPLEYVSEGDKLVPLYPTVTNNSFQVLNQKSIDIMLQNISEGDEAKNNYTILGGELQLFILEENLARYFASTETFKNSYSVKVYETIVSNINGGKGVFGAYVKRTLPVRISPSYIQSFGYSVN